MALSLDQVKKKAPAKKKVAKVEALESAPMPEIERAKIRPWSQRGLAKEGRSPKDRIHADSHMNEDWVNLQEAPLFWMDLAPENRIASIEEKLIELEAKATRLLKTPLRLMGLAKARVRSILS